VTDGMTPVTGADGEVLGWMQAPDPVTGKYDGDTVPVVLSTAAGDPVAMTNLDTDYFGAIDESLVPDELTGAELVAHWWDDPERLHWVVPVQPSGCRFLPRPGNRREARPARAGA
jgi:hypothetical protein